MDLAAQGLQAVWLRAWQRQHPGVNACEDRRLEVASQRPVSVEAQLLLLDQRLAA